MYKIFSVDDHIIEPADVWTSRVPAAMRDRAPQVIEEDGRQYWQYEDQRILTMGLNAVAGHPREAWTMEPARYEDMIPGCFDPKERAKDMLSQGVLASVNFPTLPRFGGMLFNSFEDKELALACVRAWNDFILEEWCPGGPEGMFVPMVICPVWDADLAAIEVERCVGLGAKALCFVENPVPDGLPGVHSGAWDPLWRSVTEADIPVCLHIGSSGFMPIVDPAMPFVSLVSLGNISGMLSVTNLLLSPVCHDFPTIKIVFSEAGIGWIPAILERADRQLERHSPWTGVRAEMKPSEIFRRNMYACMVEEPIGLTLHELIGVDNILVETDYPHSDSTYPKVQEAFEEVFSGIDEDVIEKVSWRNAEELFDWKMADAALLDDPDVAAWRKALATDPHAALGHRRGSKGVIVVDGIRNRCGETVLSGAMSVECGLPLGPDGRCEAGHAVRSAVG